MADLNARDAKLIQYLNEAHAKETELETALQAHIGMTNRAPYKKRLQQHLKETKGHARQLERRLKKLGGGTARVPELASRAVATAKGPLHMLRGTSEEEKLLKNAKTEYSEEHEEIATYTAIETLAEEVGDKETAKLARGIRREEERMAKYLEGLIPTLTKAVAKAEIPASERRTGSSRRRRSSSSTRRKSSSGSRKKTSSSSRRSGSSGRSSGTRSSGSSRRSSGSSSRRSTGSSRRSSGSSSRRSTGSSRRSGSSGRSSGSRGSGSRSRSSTGSRSRS